MFKVVLGEKSLPSCRSDKSAEALVSHLKVGDTRGLVISGEVISIGV